MELRLFTRTELWKLLEKEENVYTRYAVVSDTEVPGSLPGIVTRELSMMWLLDSDKVEMITSVFHLHCLTVHCLSV